LSGSCDLEPGGPLNARLSSPGEPLWDRITVGTKLLFGRVGLADALAEGALTLIGEGSLDLRSHAHAEKCAQPDELDRPPETGAAPAVPDPVGKSEVRPGKPEGRVHGEGTQGPERGDPDGQASKK
jgi:hypothetical protein